LKQQLAAALDSLVPALRPVLDSTPAETVASAPPLPLDSVPSREVAAQLARLLSEFDPGAADFITAHQAALRPLFADTAWPEFERLVQGYAFAEAETRLNEALKEVL
jgi:hypothetical protein